MDPDGLISGRIFCFHVDGSIDGGGGGGEGLAAVLGIIFRKVTESLATRQLRFSHVSNWVRPRQQTSGECRSFVDLDQ